MVAGNWKMNLDKQEADALTGQLNELLSIASGATSRVVIFPAFIHIPSAIAITANNARISVGAQNCSEHISGAFTGEVSAGMIQSAGCTHVLIGHSERRSYFKEDTSMLVNKTLRALESSLQPLFCLGESLNERKSGAYADVIAEQLKSGLFHLSREQFEKCTLAYEPVWAIGTGLTASPEQAQEVHALLRKLIIEQYGEETGNITSILYGGSCNEHNAAELFQLPDVDGGLIGGASLKAESFVKIVNSLPSA